MRQLPVRGRWLTAARARGFRMLILDAIRTAALFYLNVCVRADTYQVVLNNARSFEQTRVYALSADEGVDLEGALSEALWLSGEVTVAFVFGRGVLERMDFEGLMYPPPVDLDTRARLFRASDKLLGRPEAFVTYFVVSCQPAPPACWKSHTTSVADRPLSTAGDAVPFDGVQ